MPTKTKTKTKTVTDTADTAAPLAVVPAPAPVPTSVDFADVRDLRRVLDALLATTGSDTTRDLVRRIAFVGNAFVSTDGHRLTKITLAVPLDPAAVAPPDAAFTVEAAQRLYALVKLVKSTDRSPKPCSISVSPQGLLVDGIDLSHVVPWTPYQFPPTDRVMPRKLDDNEARECDRVLGVNAHYLASACERLVALTTGQVGVRVQWPEDRCSPLRVDAVTDYLPAPIAEATVVVMPMRI